MELDFLALPTPCYVLDEDRLTRNLEILRSVIDRAGCKILLAQKGFSMFSVYPLIGRYLHGTTASSLYEARLGREEVGGETHIYAPAYRDEDFEEILAVCDHIVFNSFDQWTRFRAQVQAAPRKIECGLRVNPGYSEVQTELYNPCAAGSRLGVTAGNFRPDLLEGLDGLHFHALCEQNADALERTLTAFEERFGGYLGGMKWLNMGGGHHITRPDYDIDRLVRLVSSASERYGVQVYLEPGEAVALNTGFLVSRVLDIVHNGMDIAILDTSAACHMPDVLEMPYRPPVVGGGLPGEKAHTVRLGCHTCLAGDVIGDYSFAAPLKPGDRVIFGDMAHYTMVKNNTFNGIGLPAIALYNRRDGARVVKTFGYGDFKGRLS
jgi:carboxynorspermidine decarboxylase